MCWLRQDHFRTWYDIGCWCQFLHFEDFAFFRFFCVMFAWSTTFLQHVSDKVLRARRPYGTYGNSIFAKTFIFQLHLPWKSRFASYTLLLLLFLCLSNLFHRRYVPCMYNIYPIYTIHPIYRLDLIDWFFSDWPDCRNINRTLSMY